MRNMDNHLYTVAQVRAIEEAACAGLPPGTLMRRAGDAAARFALELLGERRDKPVLVLAGPGNNGGDALEVAANLADGGVDATVLFQPGQREISDEAQSAHERARSGTVGFIDVVGAVFVVLAGARYDRAVEVLQTLDFAVAVDTISPAGAERPSA